MRAVILAVVCGLALAATPLQAAPVPTKALSGGLGVGPSLELVRDGCGPRLAPPPPARTMGFWHGGDWVPDEGRPYGGYGAGTYYPPPFGAALLHQGGGVGNR